MILVLCRHATRIEIDQFALPDGSTLTEYLCTDLCGRAHWTLAKPGQNEKPISNAEAIEWVRNLGRYSARLALQAIAEASSESGIAS